MKTLRFSPIILLLSIMACSSPDPSAPDSESFQLESDALKAKIDSAQARLDRSHAKLIELQDSLSMLQDTLQGIQRTIKSANSKPGKHIRQYNVPK